ncbi:MBL fold metallo-hydrolase [candidate division KSB1 bacterium]|nr:MBL fold metallo-hydrolase [candidate division KSB1 bacterium]
MKKLYLFIFIILFAISAVAALWQDFAKVEVKATKVAGSVYMIAGTDDMAAFSGGNIGVSVGEDGVIMVDSKFAPLGDKIKAAIKEIGGDLPKYVINTHVHDDHLNGNSVFSADGTIIAHTNIRKRLADKPKNLWPVITFDQSLSIHMNGEEIKAIHYPKGHTDGDAIIYFTGSNVVHMGDHLFNKMFPFVDLNSGGTVQGFMANTKKTLEEIPENVKLIAGHGPLASKADLQENYRMLQETVALVTQKMKAGTSLDDIKKEGLQEEWKSWSWNFITEERWIEKIHNSYLENSSSN